MLWSSRSHRDAPMIEVTCSWTQKLIQRCVEPKRYHASELSLPSQSSALPKDVPSLCPFSLLASTLPDLKAGRCELRSMDASGNVEAVEVLRRQYLQLLDPGKLVIPSPSALRSPDIQARIYQRLFDDSHVKYSPPTSYQLRILKRIIKAVEAAIDDPDEDVCMQHSPNPAIWSGKTIPHRACVSLIDCVSSA